MIAVLCARRDSVYKSFSGVEVYDADRDAFTFTDRCPVIAHPPCAQWGRLRCFANDRPEEKKLGPFCVEMVRKNGGILEHPIGSLLWEHCELPRYGQVDEFGGWTQPVSQYWWGHRALKATWLYVVGIPYGQLPRIPFRQGEPAHVVGTCKKERRHCSISHAEREQTPLLFALWLVETANRIAGGMECAA